VDASGDLLQEGCRNLIVGRVFGQVNGDEELLCLRIDIANVDTSLVREEDPIALKGSVC
jgi:hypothetical protein